VGSVGLVKTTAGTVTLSGANTYTGKSSIQGGTLNLSGSLTGKGDDVFLETSGVILDGLTTGVITDRGVVVNAGKTNTFVRNFSKITNSASATGVVVNNNASVTIRGNTIQNNQIGVLVDGGTALIESNNLSFNTKGAPGVAGGLVAQNGAIVDAGQNPTGYYTHFTGLAGGTGPLGASAGLNVFKGYPYLGANDWQPNVPKAIRNLNTGGTYSLVGPQFGSYDLTAMNNTFDGSPSLFLIEKQLYHDIDQSNLGFIAYGNSITPATMTDMRYYAVNPTLTYASGPPDYTQLTTGNPTGTFQASSIRRLRTTYDGYVFIDMKAGASTIPIGGALAGTGGVQIYKKNGPALTSSNNSGFVQLTIVAAAYNQNTGAYTTDFAFSNLPGQFQVEPNGSLTDGNYDLGLVSSLIQGGGPGGAPLTNPTTRSFHRFFGDFNGDRRVNNQDLTAMQASLGSIPGTAAYRGYFNFDTVDLITGTDYAAFVRRYRFMLNLDGTTTGIVP
ncbi:MAG: autotransporter-associated beta strand repeat-containing protein, partial [Gemmataceae bacterium]|nr:autotransporter-associated beta strand repeat-containing protein [Gemmataceae bacterium]